MSIESKIDELIAALDRNTMAMNATAVMSATAKAADKPAKPAKAQAEPPAAPVAPDVKEEAKPLASGEDVPRTTGPALDYKTDVRPIMYQVSNEKGADAARALLATFQAKLGTDLKPTDYARFIAAAKKVLTS